ncbi:MAG: 3-methyladenine DNA glycosylase [Alphaproteobacteria bacterium 41-28]|nr:MAG: 3-methyladenine DNA glycosylase [Alphaproteobacteria bacterium 41-28]
MADRLSRDFFSRPTLTVAQELLGKIMIFGTSAGIITETEAYIGQDDPACHAARGKTPRNAVMFGPAGFSYVYFIYGMYHCLNFVTEEEGFPGAVLIRGLMLIEPSPLHLNGPGKLCRHLGITRDHNALDLTEHGTFYVKESPICPPYEATPRIGINKGQEKLWRFVIKNQAFEI